MRRCLVACVAAVLALSACSPRTMAVRSLGDAMAQGGGSFASDDDPDLVGDALPFALKTTEGLLLEAPRHKGLLLAAARGFAQYAYGWVQMEADFVEPRDLAQATAMRARARRLYRRAQEYGLRGLEVDLPGLREGLRTDAAASLRRARKEHVPLLYWTATAWAAAIGLGDADLAADQKLVEAFAQRALALDEGFDGGALHEFFIAFEGRRVAVGGEVEKARTHFDRAVQLGGGRRALPYVFLAEHVTVGQQRKQEFESLLRQALAVDVASPSDHRLIDLLAQKRARWLLAREDELFVE